MYCKDTPRCDRGGDAHVIAPYFELGCGHCLCQNCVLVSSHECPLCGWVPHPAVSAMFSKYCDSVAPPSTASVAVPATESKFFNTYGFYLSASLSVEMCFLFLNRVFSEATAEQSIRSVFTSVGEVVPDQFVDEIVREVHWRSLRVGESHSFPAADDDAPLAGVPALVERLRRSPAATHGAASVVLSKHVVNLSLLLDSHGRSHVFDPYGTGRQRLPFVATFARDADMLAFLSRRLRHKASPDLTDCPPAAPLDAFVIQSCLPHVPSSPIFCDASAQEADADVGDVDTSLSACIFPRDDCPAASPQPPAVAAAIAALRAHQQPPPPWRGGGGGGDDDDDRDARPRGAAADAASSRPTTAWRSESATTVGSSASAAAAVAASALQSPWRGPGGEEGGEADAPSHHHHHHQHHRHHRPPLPREQWRSGSGGGSVQTADPATGAFTLVAQQQQQQQPPAPWRSDSAQTAQTGVSAVSSLQEAALGVPEAPWLGARATSALLEDHYAQARAVTEAELLQRQQLREWERCVAGTVRCKTYLRASTASATFSSSSCSSPFSSSVAGASAQATRASAHADGAASPELLPASVRARCAFPGSSRPNQMLEALRAPYPPPSASASDQQAQAVPTATAARGPNVTGALDFSNVSTSCPPSPASDRSGLPPRSLSSTSFAGSEAGSEDPAVAGGAAAAPPPPPTEGDGAAFRSLTAYGSARSTSGVPVARVGGRSASAVLPEDFVAAAAPTALPDAVLKEHLRDEKFERTSVEHAETSAWRALRDWESIKHSFAVSRARS